MKFRYRDLGSALMWALACTVLAYLWTVQAAWVFSGVGGFLGYYVGIALGRTRLRAFTGLGCVWLAYALGSLLAGLPAATPWMAQMLGADVAYVLSQIAEWFVQSLALVTALRFLSERFPSLVALEILTVALMVSSPLAAHRDGFINRPFFLVDPLWSNNHDPVPVLFGLGALLAGVLIVLSLGRRTRRASIWDLLLLLLLLGGLYTALPIDKLKQILPKPRGSDGLQGDPKPSRGGKGGSKADGKGGTGKDNDPMPMDKPQDQSQSNTPVAVVIMHDDYTPPYGIYYFRETAFSQFNGKRLVADVGGADDIDLIENFPTEPTAVRLAGPRVMTGFAHLKTTVALVESHTKPFGLVDAVAVAPVANPAPSEFVRAYEVDSEVLHADFQYFFKNQVGSQNWTPEQWKHYTTLPADPRYLALANKIADRLPVDMRSTPMAKALAVKFYLDETVTYSLKATHEGVDDPVADYLFVNPKGYCVHQAHAAVYLMRALGLPARVGAGYASDARNRGGGSTIMLRTGEAHAWPELYVRDVGWVVIDISPKKNDEQEMAQPDPGLQRMLGEKARNGEKRDPQEKKEFQKKSVQEVMRDWAREFSLAGLVAAGVALSGLYAIKYYRRFEPLFCGQQRLGVAALRSAMDQMAEVGETRRFGEGRLEFARRVGHEALIPLTELHHAHAHGQTTSDSVRVLRLREEVHQQLARKYAWWRRLLGFIDPTSWLRSR